MPPTPRRADWLGIPRTVGVDDYVPRDHLEREQAARAAMGISTDWLVPLTRCGEPSLPDSNRRALLPRPQARNRTLS